MVNRYDLDLDNIQMAATNDGDFVYYYDYEDLYKKYVELVEKIGELWKGS